MSIVEFEGPPSWSLDASETGESTKCPWVGVMEGTPLHPHAIKPTASARGHLFRHQHPKRDQILDFIPSKKTSISDLFISNLPKRGGGGEHSLTWRGEIPTLLTETVTFIMFAIMDNTIVAHDPSILYFNGLLKLDNILGVALIVRKYYKDCWISSVIYNRIK